MSHMKEGLTIFLGSGKTYTFRDVKVLNDNQTQLVFQYAAVSDGIPKVGNFLKNDNFAGTCLFAYDDDE